MPPPMPSQVSSGVVPLDATVLGGDTVLEGTSAALAPDILGALEQLLCWQWRPEARPYIQQLSDSCGGGQQVGSLTAARVLPAVILNWGCRVASSTSRLHRP